MPFFIHYYTCLINHTSSITVKYHYSFNKPIIKEKVPAGVRGLFGKCPRALKCEFVQIGATGIKA